MRFFTQAAEVWTTLQGLAPFGMIAIGALFLLSLILTATADMRRARSNRGGGKY